MRKPIRVKRVKRIIKSMNVETKKYLMVTNWDDHWDQIQGTYYTRRMLKDGIKTLVEGTPTIFVKINKDTKKPECGWEGTIKNIREEPDKIRFDVVITGKVDVNNVNKREGCYWTSSGLPPVSGKKEPDVFSPPFFKELQSTENWEYFEDFSYYLLRAIGIHDIIKIPRNDSRGKWDGFFTIGTLVVGYDAKLSQPDDAQIENYCSALSRGRYEFGNKKYDFRDKNKQVWIIKKEKTSEDKYIGEVKVKIVPIHELIEIYQERLKGDWDLNQLVAKLTDV